MTLIAKTCWATALLLGSALAAVPAAAAPPRSPSSHDSLVYHVHKLGLPDGYSIGEGSFINEQGDVAGRADGFDQARQLLLWPNPGGLRSLGAAPAGASWDSVTGLNDVRQLTGSAVRLGNGRLISAFVWSSDQGMREVPAPPGITGSTYGGPINNAGQMLGQADVAAEGDRATFAWLGGAASHLVAPAIHSWPGGLTDAGYSVATASPDHSRVTHAVMRSPDGSLLDLGALPTTRDNGSSEAAAVSENLWVAGSSHAGNRRNTHPFLWSAGTGMLDLGLLPGDESAWASGVNNDGHVVGHRQIGSRSVGFLWTPAGGMQDLLSLVADDDDKARLRDIRPTGINNAGQIVGTAQWTNGQTTAVRLDPQP